MKSLCGYCLDHVLYIMLCFICLFAIEDFIQRCQSLHFSLSLGFFISCFILKSMDKCYVQAVIEAAQA